MKTMKSNHLGTIKVLSVLLFYLFTFLPLSAKQVKPAVSVSNLRVENLTNPLGIDTDKPVFRG